MNSPRIKIFTRSFDLRLYRLAKGLFGDMRDKEGNPIPCVRLTDQTADGYFYTILKDTTCDIAINIDEDAFVVDPDAIMDLVDIVVKEGYANAGCPDFRDGSVTNPFFNVINLQLLRTKFDHSLITGRSFSDPEPYYPLFLWVAANFPTLYLHTQVHSDSTTTIVLHPDGRAMCLHTWFSRFYSMPSWLVRLVNPGQRRQKPRIDAIISEAYGIRSIPLPDFRPKDRFEFAGNKILRWTIKIPQRVSKWPWKLRRALNRRR